MPAGIAPDSYDEYVNRFTKPWNDYLIKRLLEEVEVRASPLQRVLDVGTGTARTLIELSRHTLFKKCKLIGIDFFEEMVEQARQIIIGYGLQEHIEIQHGDVHHIDLPDNSIDIIFLS